MNSPHQVVTCLRLGVGICVYYACRYNDDDYVSEVGVRSTQGEELTGGIICFRSGISVSCKS